MVYFSKNVLVLTILIASALAAPTTRGLSTQLPQELEAKLEVRTNDKGHTPTADVVATHNPHVEKPNYTFAKETDEAWKKWNLNMERFNKHKADAEKRKKEDEWDRKIGGEMIDHYINVEQHTGVPFAPLPHVRIPRPQTPEPKRKLSL